MPENKPLGRLVAVHPITPAHLQRAVFIAALSFIFFVGMMFAYYLRQHIGYFLLSTAFLIIYLVMMFSFVTGRKKVVEVYENGVRVTRESLLWTEIDSIDDSGKLTFGSKDLILPAAITDREAVIQRIRSSTN